MNELRTAEGIKSIMPDLFFLEDPSHHNPHPRSDYAVPMYQIHSEMMNSTLKVPSHCSADTDDSFTNFYTQKWTGDLQEMSLKKKKFPARKREEKKKSQLEVN